MISNKIAKTKLIESSITFRVLKSDKKCIQAEVQKYNCSNANRDSQDIKKPFQK